MGEHVAVLPGGDDHVVAGVGAADGGRAAGVTRHPELGLETLGAAWATRTRQRSLTWRPIKF